MTTREATRVEAGPPATSAETLFTRIEKRLEVPPWALLVQVFIGLGWIRAAVEKIIDPYWWNGTVLSSFLDAQANLALPWYQLFIDMAVERNILAISIIVVLAQLLAGFSLLVGWKLRAGLATGIFLNLNFVAAGAVNPSIFYLVCQAALLLWILQDSGRKRPLRLLATASTLQLILNAPFISTLEPAEVIEDPAMILVTLGLLTALASRAGVRHAVASVSPN